MIRFPQDKNVRSFRRRRSARITRAAWGLAIIFCGQPLAWAIRGELHLGDNAIFPAAAVLVGFLLMLSSTEIWQPRLRCKAQLLLIPIVFLYLPTILFSLPIFTDYIQLPLYALFSAGVAVAVGYIKREDLEPLPFSIALIGLAACIIPYLQILQSGISPDFVRLTIVGNNNTLMLAELGTITALACVLMTFESVRGGFIKGTFAGIGVLIGCGTLVLTNTRSYMISLVISLLVYIFVLYSRSTVRARSAPVRGTRLRVGFFVALFVGLSALAVAATAFLSQDVAKVATRAYESRILGAADVLTGSSTGTIDPSSGQREQYIAETWKGLGVIGRGFMAQSQAKGNWFYPHLTYLQAFYDFGAIGALVYSLSVLFIPGAICFLVVLRRQILPLETFIIMLFIVAQIDMLTHGVPYGWRSLLPVMLVYTVLSRKLIARPSQNFNNPAVVES